MRTYFEHGEERLVSLCETSNLGAKVPEAVDLFHAMTSPWGQRPLGQLGGTWLSDVADDHTPYEFSVVFGRRSEIRILVEAQGDPPSLQANWEAGLALSRRLHERYGLDLARQERVVPLFAPQNADGRLGIWHAVSVGNDGPPEVKVYFDAQARGRWRAPALVEEALERVGFQRAWPAIARMGRRGPDFDELKYFSLDLSPSPEARVKVYWRHHDVTASHLAEIVDDAGVTRAETQDFCRQITGHGWPYGARPVFTCTSLTDPGSVRPASRTVYVPIAAYANTDAIGSARVEQYLSRLELAAPYRRMMDGLSAQRPLDRASGLMSYVSVQRRNAEPRVTVYLSPEAHVVRPPRAPASASQADVLAGERIVEKFEQDQLVADHPFFQRMRREAPNLSHLWLILANFWEGVVHDFPARLSQFIARVDDDRVRSIFVKQLNDELGEGDYSRAHKPMYKRFVNALEPYRMAGDHDAIVAPGRAFSRALAEHLYCADTYQNLGALMIVEIYGKQADMRLGEEFRRQSSVPPSALEWLNLHETLEQDHADDSLVVARLLPRPDGGPIARAQLAAAWRGAEGVVAATRAFFDALYERCYATPGA